MARELCLNALPSAFLLFLALLLGGRVARTQIISVTFELPDNVVADTSLGNISARSNAIPQPVSPYGYYRVIINPNRFADRYFRVDPRTSGLFTKTSIDRDKVCLQLACCHLLRCRANFTVFIGLSSSRSEKVIVSVVLRDENDNTPVIQIEEISLPESTPVDSTRPLPVATDRDSDVNSVRSYRLSDPSGTFALFMSDAKKPMLSVQKELDADDPVRRNFDLPYSAVDGGDPPRIGEVKLRIRVMDENDNAPVFEVNSKTKWISEDARQGTEVYQFQATDRDSDPDNRRISYHLNPTHSTPAGVAASRFAVNPISGVVTVLSKLDYDVATERTYRLVVEARDGGSPALSTTATLSVILKNINDNDPKIAVTSSQDLEEERSPGQRVRTISVSDADEHTSINVNCTLVDSDGFAISTITENHYFDIVTTRVFDFETTPEVKVTIVCTDLTPPTRTVKKTLRIPVVDINDHDPVFLPFIIHKDLPENAPMGTEILTVQATDKDSGKAGEIRYALDAIGASLFEIDSLRGILYVNSSLDREADQMVIFKIWASDLGTPSRRGFAEIRINLTDVNDNAPALVGPKAVDVVENVLPGTVITRVAFRDPDEGDNGLVVFKLIRDNNLSLKYLNMTPDGRVMVTSPIDREVASRMYLDIQARDHGSPILETTVSIIIRVLDLNDNRPRLVNPEPYSTVSGSDGRRLYANSPFNTTVGRLWARDGDLRENGTVVYEIIDTNATGMFRINERTGRIYSGWKYPSQPGHGIYRLQIRLSDKGRPPLTSRSTLFVDVGPPSSDPEGTASEGMSKIIILVLVLIASVAMATTLLMAILWARSRTKRSSRNSKRSLDYADYDPAVKQSRTIAETEIVGNPGIGNGDPLADNTSTMTRSQKTSTRMSQYTDYTNPYAMTSSMSTVSKRDQRSQIGFETFGPQTSLGQSYPLESYGTASRHGIPSPAPHQQRSTTITNSHLLPEMFEDDPRQSELSYDDSGKGGSLDDVGRLVLGQHVTSATSVMGFSHHPVMSRMTLRAAHPGCPGNLTEGGEETMC